MKQYIYALALFMGLGPLLTAQSTQTTFGKNRVQYHTDFDQWLQYESDNFITYWYGEARNIGQSVVQFAEYDFQHIQNILEHRINDKLQLIVYTDITDLKQSNIGSEEAFTNTGGLTKIVGNKIFVYFDGNHNHLRRDIREGIASLYLDAMLFGTNLQEIVQNAVMMNLPEWFKQGLVAYVGEEWNTKLDNQLRDILLNEDFKGFERFAEDYPKLAGHSLWYYISESFGTSTVSNLLYLTRINRSVESGFLYVLGSPYEVVTNSWAKFFMARYKAEVALCNEPDGRQLEFKNKRNLPITQVKMSPDGQQIAYVTNEIGKYKVYVQDVRKGKRKVVFKGGFRNAFQATDYNYPLIAWNPNAQDLAILSEKRDIVRLHSYNVKSGKTETETIANQYQRINSMDFVNPFALVFSATINGYSDIYVYYTKTRQTERITNDFYDDLDATYVKFGRQQGIMFASNRPDSILSQLRLDTILPINSFDLFFYDMDTKSKELVRITRTPNADERYPMQVDTTHFSFLTDQSGISNRKVGYLEEYIHHYDQFITLEDGSEIVINADSTLANIDSLPVDTIIIVPIVKQRAVNHPVSNYDRGILSQHTSPRVGKQVELLMRNGAYTIYRSDVVIDTTIAAAPTAFHQYRSKAKITPVTSTEKIIPQVTVLDEVTKITLNPQPTPTPETDKTKPDKEDDIDIDNYLFQSEFDDDEEPVMTIKEEKPKADRTTPENDVDDFQVVSDKPVQNNSAGALPPPGYTTDGVYRYRPGLVTPYRLKFRTDYVTTQLDNSLLFEGLESFSANPNGFNYPPLGILLKTNFKDLFEDYEFEGGVRVPTNFNGTEYFLIFKDKKRRLDKQFAFYRKNVREPNDEAGSFVQAREEYNIVLGQFRVSYPLDIFRSIRATATIRRDRSLLLGTEGAVFNESVRREPRGILRFEYVFDNTLDVALNIKNGTRYKIYAEVAKRFNVDAEDGVKLSFGDGIMNVIGIDARHYQRLDRNSILAVRFAAATSFGSERILFYLGGVDNGLFNNFSREIPVPSDIDFAYQVPATNLRGFQGNIRNGNSFALINTELRVPVFKYFSRNIRSGFFRNFQLVGFFDVGTAWSGLNPLSDENPLNISNFPETGPLNPPVSVRVKYFRDPIVAGYGIGVRSVLFGYFIRLDYAWGVETRTVLDPRLHLSLGVDF